MQNAQRSPALLSQRSPALLSQRSPALLSQRSGCPGFFMPEGIKKAWRRPTLPPKAVPSAQEGLTSVFGMETGGTPPLSITRLICISVSCQGVEAWAARHDCPGARPLHRLVHAFTNTRPVGLCVRVRRAREGGTQRNCAV